MGYRWKKPPPYFSANKYCPYLLDKRFSYHRQLIGVRPVRKPLFTLVSSNGKAQVVIAENTLIPEHILQIEDFR